MMDQEQIAAFLAKKQVTVCPPKPAYGVNPAADKAAREAARQPRRRAANDQAYDEGRFERYVERVNDAYMSGGSRARDEEMSCPW